MQSLIVLVHLLTDTHKLTYSNLKYNVLFLMSASKQFYLNVVHMEHDNLFKHKDFNTNILFYFQNSYLKLYTLRMEHSWSENIIVLIFTNIFCLMQVLINLFQWRRKEGNILFNDALNTFYFLCLYCIRHMVHG